jgi:hypothetical protein
VAGLFTIMTGDHKHRVPKGDYIPLVYMALLMGTRALVVSMSDFSTIVTDVRVGLLCQCSFQCPNFLAQRKRGPPMVFFHIKWGRLVVGPSSGSGSVVMAG